MKQAKKHNTMHPIKGFKKFVFFFLYFIFTLFFIPHPIYAHVLKTDGSIGAVLHINPNDEPSANQPSTLVFEFKDKSGTFTAKNCDCMFSILNNEKTIYSQPLFQNTTSQDNYAAITYTFPQSNIYQVQVRGKPLEGSSFKPFTLSWDIRVTAATDTQSDTAKNIAGFPSVVILFTIVIIAGIILFVRNRSKQNK